MSTKNESSSSSGGPGCLFFLGFLPAAWCSFAINHSLLWAAFHGFFWWAYLPYLCLGCGGGLPKDIPW